MRRILLLAAAAPLMVLAGSCAHVRPPPLAPPCNYRALPLAVSSDHPGPVGGPEAAPVEATFADELASTLSGPVTGPESGRRKELLVLSGGSQHGAFGGGFFLGLPNVPTYDLVTGVSTGALQSTLVFLANDPPPTDRAYPADLGEGKLKPGVSNLGDLGAALSISGEPTLLKVAKSRELATVTKGAVASLDPLRARLLGFLSEGTLQRIKFARERQGRKLFVGVTDLDDGRGYAIDLTELATRLGDPSKSPNDAASLRACYVNALIASSSVPLAAYPVTLDIKPDGQPAKRDLFIDGGARFGVFLRQIGDELRRRGAMQPTNVTVIVNGKLYGKPWRADGVRPEKWSSLTLARRSVDLLTNQVYRFSVDDAEHFPRAGGELRMAFISNENLTTLTEDPAAHSYEYARDGKAETRTCDAWSDVDDADGKPAEFHARYMACLLDYGRTRGRTEPWNRHLTGP